MMSSYSLRTSAGYRIQRVSATGGAPVDVIKTKGRTYGIRCFFPMVATFSTWYLARQLIRPVLYVARSMARRTGEYYQMCRVRCSLRPARGDRTGHILFVRQNTLMAVPFDATSAQVSGEVLPGG